ncbi:hypothetical protein Tco_1273231 [Tanacetum coccineum]
MVKQNGNAYVVEWEEDGRHLYGRGNTIDRGIVVAGREGGVVGANVKRRDVIIIARSSGAPIPYVCVVISSTNAIKVKRIPVFAILTMIEREIGVHFLLTDITIEIFRMIINRRICQWDFMSLAVPVSKGLWRPHCTIHV